MQIICQLDIANHYDDVIIINFLYFCIHTGWFAVSLLLVVCSALCKEIGITAVALCLMYELLIIRKVCLKTKIFSAFP